MSSLINRTRKTELREKLLANKLLLLRGPRGSGKRTLVREVLQELGKGTVEIDLSTRKLRKKFKALSTEEKDALFASGEFILLNEAQYLEDLQELIEQVLSGKWKGTFVLSCSFDPVLDEVLKEVLVLQGLEIYIDTISFYELTSYLSLPEVDKNMEQRLIFGNYPKVVAEGSNGEEVIELLNEVLESQFGVNTRVNKQDKLMRALAVISHHVGEPVSYNEIASNSGLDNETIERYVDLLVENGILIRIPTLYSGHRYELKKTHVIFFSDNGIRNAVIRNFNPIEFRLDLDQLWKNWLISERIKWNRMNGRKANYFFWRTHTKQMIDFIEVNETGKFAYKTTWDKKKKVKFPAMFGELYPDYSQHTLNKSTYWTFLSKK
ncbi:MAG: ATP-binding protein [Bacteroidetes bacterium]|nr:MAG: ATP-binding protein [Bacteroidota bacterium]